MKRILVVDDEVQMRTMLDCMLQDAGYEVHTAEHGEEGLAKMRQHSFDLVITDQTMPGMTGLDLARRLLERKPELPIILCTGYSTLVSTESAAAAGIRAFAMKPLAKREIAALVRRVLDERVAKD